jgi:hypothetical protein
VNVCRKEQGVDETRAEFRKEREREDKACKKRSGVTTMIRIECEYKVKHFDEPGLRERGRVVEGMDDRGICRAVLTEAEL